MSPQSVRGPRACAAGDGGLNGSLTCCARCRRSFEKCKMQVAVGPQGHIYVTEFGNDRVSVLVARRKQVQDLLPRARSAGGSSP
jgi:hypothetical protein